MGKTAAVHSLLATQPMAVAGVAAGLKRITAASREDAAAAGPPKATADLAHRVLTAGSQGQTFSLAAAVAAWAVLEQTALPGMSAVLVAVAS